MWAPPQPALPALPLAPAGLTASRQLTAAACRCPLRALPQPCPAGAACEPLQCPLCPLCPHQTRGGCCWERWGCRRCCRRWRSQSAGRCRPQRRRRRCRPRAAFQPGPDRAACAPSPECGTLPLLLHHHPPLPMPRSRRRGLPHLHLLGAGLQLAPRPVVVAAPSRALQQPLSTLLPLLPLLLQTLLVLLLLPLLPLAGKVPLAPSPCAAPSAAACWPRCCAPSAASRCRPPAAAAAAAHWPCRVGRRRRCAYPPRWSLASPACGEWIQASGGCGKVANCLRRRAAAAAGGSRPRQLCDAR